MKSYRLSTTQHLLYLVLCTALCIPTAYAQPQKESAINWGMDLRIQREHQDFDDSDAQLNTLSLQPYMQVGNWDISLNLPWQQIDGEYFVNGFQPTPSRICERLSSLSFLQRQVLLNRGRITNEQLNYCDNQSAEPEVIDSSVSGMSDVSLMARYAMPLDQQGVWLGSLGLGYKWDNGDKNSGIGSGTRDTTADLSLSGLSGKWIGFVSVGHVWISGGVAYSEVDETNDEVINYGYDDYAYATLDGGYKFTDWLTLGARANIQQAYIPGGEDVKWLTAYANFRVYKKFRLRTYVNDYLDVAAYPEQEFGASLSYSF